MVIIDRVNEILYIFDLDPITEDSLAIMLSNFLEGFEPDALIEPITNAFGGVASALFTFFVALVSSVYLLVDKDRFLGYVSRIFSAFISKPVYDVIVKYIHKISYYFKSYVTTQTVDGVILGFMMTVTLRLFGSPFFLVLGLILGIVNYVPYFGSIFGTIFAVIIVAFTQGFNTALFVAPVMLIIQQFDGNIIQPALMSDAFKMRPLLIIISVTVGGAYAGVIGMLVAIPMAAVLRDIVEAIIGYMETKKQEKANSPAWEGDPSDWDGWG